MPFIVTNNFPPEFGGVQTYMLRLANEIHASGRRVIVVAPGTTGSQAYDRELPYPTIRYRSFRRVPFAKALEFAALNVTLVGALLQSEEKEAIASAWWPAGAALAIMTAFLRRRFIVIAHGMEIKPNSSKLRRSFMRYTFERSHAIVANSSFTRKLLADAGIGHRTTTISCGVDESFVQPIRSTRPTVLSVGRLIERKGFDRMLQAIALILPTIPNVCYEIVGDGPQLAELQRLCSDLRITDRVTFLGSLSNEELLAAYARAWCFALPARRINDDVEGFGIVYLEAAMCELATVGGIDSGAIDAIEAGHTGVIVNGDDPHSIAQALEKLLTDRELADTMGKRGRERARRDFRWPDLTEKFLKLLAQ